jgi:hypothetical protein
MNVRYMEVIEAMFTRTVERPMTAVAYSRDRGESTRASTAASS